jgi:hypothetical protein
MQQYRHHFEIKTKEANIISPFHSCKQRHVVYEQKSKLITNKSQY